MNDLLGQPLEIGDIVICNGQIEPLGIIVQFGNATNAKVAKLDNATPDLESMSMFQVSHIIKFNSQAIHMYGEHKIKSAQDIATAHSLPTLVSKKQKTEYYVAILFDYAGKGIAIKLAATGTNKEEIQNSIREQNKKLIDQYFTKTHQWRTKIEYGVYDDISTRVTFQCVTHNKKKVDSFHPYPVGQEISITVNPKFEYVYDF